MGLNVCCFARITFNHAVKGGMEVHTRVLSEALVARGHEVTILTTSLEPDEELVREENGVEIHYLPVPTPGRYSPEYLAASDARFRKLHANRPFDVVWSESMGALGYVKATRPNDRLPLFTILQGGTMTAIVTSFRTRNSLAGGVYYFFKNLPGQLRQHFSMYLPVVRACRFLVCPSPQTAREVHWEGLVPWSRIVTSVNGIDTDTFRPDAEQRARGRERLGVTEDEFLLFNVGRISADKGIDVLLKALPQCVAALPGLRLAVAGVGPELPKLEALAAELNLQDRVHFVGFVPNEEVSHYYNACDIFVCPTVRMESFGIVLAEAMACARPVVSSAAGGTRWVVEDGVSGILVPPRDVDTLARAIIALATDSDRAAALGKHARSRAVEELSSRRMADDTEDLMRRLVGEARA